MASAAPLDVDRCRRQFPALDRRQDGRPVVYLDGPAGSQVPSAVIEAIGGYLSVSNANTGGTFATSRETGELLAGARRAVADLLGSDEPDLVAFGPSMTALTWTLARALARTWSAGDEVIVTRLDHDANFTPWVRAAREVGAEARYLSFRTDDCTLDLDELETLLGERTRLVAVGAASNAVGTVNPVRHIAERAHAVGARLFVDAVHYAPHRLIDVEEWNCDFVACSAYKFFGPHVGMLWGRREPMERLPVDRLRPASDEVPGRWASGTDNHEGIVGSAAAIDYLASIGRHVDPGVAGRRRALELAFAAIGDHERALGRYLIQRLSALDTLTIWGITDPRRSDERVPTVSFTHDRLTPREVAEQLGRRGVFAWYGNYYALPVTEALGLEPGGMVRVGLLHYNTRDEVDRLIEALEDLRGPARPRSSP